MYTQYIIVSIGVTINTQKSFDLVYLAFHSDVRH